VADVRPVKFELSAIDNVSRTLDGIKGSFGRLENSYARLTQLAAGFGVALSVGALKSYIDGVIDATARLDDLAEQSGATVEALSKINQVAKIGGHDIGAASDAIATLAKRLNGVDDESKGAAQALADIGLSIDDVRKGDPGEVFIDIARRMGEYGNSLGKTQRAQELYGKGAAVLLPFMNDIAEAGELVANVTAEQASAAERYQKSVNRLAMETEKLGKSITKSLLPVMQDVVDFLTDLKKGSDTLGTNEGITEWARTGVLGVAGLYDIIKDTLALMSQVPRSVAVVVNDLVTVARIAGEIGTTFTLSGGQRAAESIQRILSERRGFVEAANEDMESRLGRPSDMQERLRAQFEKSASVRNAIQAGIDGGADIGRRPVRPTLGARGAESKKDGAGKASNDYLNLITSIRERTAALQLEAEATDKVAESDKTAAKIAVDLAAGKLTLTIQQRASIDAALAEQRVQERQIELNKIAAAQLQEDIRVRKARTDEALKRADAVEEEVRRQREANEEIGLEAEALEAVRDARMADTIAIRERQLAVAQLTSDSAAEIEALREEVEALRTLRNLRSEGAIRQRAASAAKEMEAEAKRAADNIERSLTDALMRGFESGKSAGENFRDTLYNMFRTLVLRPIIEAQVKPIAGAVNAAMGSVGGGGILGGLGKWLGIGGGADPMAGTLGFGSGGAFRVGGSGGTDSQLVAFRASPDETVTVTRPEQSAGGGGSVTVINNNTIDARSDQASILMMLERNRQMTIASIQNALARNGAGNIAAAMA